MTTNTNTNNGSTNGGNNAMATQVQDTNVPTNNANEPVQSTYNAHIETDVNDDGRTSTVKTHTNETLVTPSRVEDIARQVYADLDHKRQALEDQRANHRNRNRVFILLVALMMTFLVPFIVANVLNDASLLKYSTLIAIAPDFALTLYAYFRKY